MGDYNDVNPVRFGLRLRPTKTVDKSAPVVRAHGETLKTFINPNEPNSNGPNSGPGPPPCPPLIPNRINKKSKSPTTANTPVVDRGKLLDEIKQGRKLRPTVTKDRSAPIVDTTEGKESRDITTDNDANPIYCIKTERNFVVEPAEPLNYNNDGNFDNEVEHANVNGHKNDYDMVKSLAKEIDNDNTRPIQENDYDTVSNLTSAVDINKNCFITENDYDTVATLKNNTPADKRCLDTENSLLDLDSGKQGHNFLETFPVVNTEKNDDFFQKHQISLPKSGVNDVCVLYKNCSRLSDEYRNSDVPAPQPVIYFDNFDHPNGDFEHAQQKSADQRKHADEGFETVPPKTTLASSALMKALPPPLTELPPEVAIERWDDTLLSPTLVGQISSFNSDGRRQTTDFNTAQQTRKRDTVSEGTFKGEKTWTNWNLDESRTPSPERSLSGSESGLSYSSAEKVSKIRPPFLPSVKELQKTFESSESDLTDSICDYGLSKGPANYNSNVDQEEGYVEFGKKERFLPDVKQIAGNYEKRIILNRPLNRARSGGDIGFKPLNPIQPAPPVYARNILPIVRSAAEPQHPFNRSNVAEYPSYNTSPYDYDRFRFHEVRNTFEAAIEANIFEK